MFSRSSSCSIAVDAWPVHANFMAYFYGHFRFVSMAKAEVGKAECQNFIWFLFENTEIDLLHSSCKKGTWACWQLEKKDKKGRQVLRQIDSNNMNRSPHFGFVQEYRCHKLFAIPRFIYFRKRLQFFILPHNLLSSSMDLLIGEASTADDWCDFGPITMNNTTNWG